MASEIRANTASMKTKMNELKKENTALKKEITNLVTLEAQLKKSWDGEASKAFQNQFNKDKVKYDKFTDEIDKFVNKLETIIKDYETTEAKNIQIASSSSK